jgi:hypothetical protein
VFLLRLCITIFGQLLGDKENLSVRAYHETRGWYSFNRLFELWYCQVFVTIKRVPSGDSAFFKYLWHFLIKKITVRLELYPLIFIIDTQVL